MLTTMLPRSRRFSETAVEYLRNPGRDQQPPPKRIRSTHSPSESSRSNQALDMLESLPTPESGILFLFLPCTGDPLALGVPSLL